LAEARPTAVVLAAGRGTRMRSDLAKVLHRAAGRPLLAWVLDAARAAGCARLVVVVGHQAERVRRAVPAAPDLDWALQERQLGTGHALAQAEAALAGEIAGGSLLLVLSGDVPLVRPETLRALAAAARGAWGALAVAELPEPGSLGRVIPRPDDPRLLDRIAEAKDATAGERALRTVNAGLYALPAAGVFPYLARLDPDNAQGELYLTDALAAAAADGLGIRLLPLADPDEAFGVNTPDELARVDRILRERQRAP
jgi:bifunctional UDP-N-acetylglucosamine pyrophosphorylase/glucosamine-1-phosphate N-acetyltransferase